DQETAKILFGAIHKTSDTITPSDIETFPIAPLRIVDRLWRKYSNDHFGLSIQLRIYQELGGNLNTLIAQDEALFFAFCDRIGWRKNGKLIVRENWEADLSAPQGFLPLTWWVTPYGLKIGNFILARLIKGGV
ncbi:MAG TPA: GUN4 domain-containing protein, partial [Allocoleopsis sp.]